MKIIKRNGSEAPFDRSKIETAIRSANSDVEPEDRMAEELLVQLAVEIEERCLHLGHEPHVEEVQDMVEDAILAEGLTALGKNYVRYRYVRQLARHANTTDAAVLSILDCVNEEAKQENSNKDPKINSVQRDYMAGELSRDITERLLLPPDIVEAHKEGIIHFHDSDYYAQREHNCFGAETAFLTMGGIKHFDEFEDGVSTFVLDRHGKWREATVHSFGTQVVNEVTLESAIGSRKVVRVTANHRWLLASGDFTEFLSVGDVLMDSPGQKCGWHVAAIRPNITKEEVWCVTEPVTHTFTLAGYVVTGNCDLVNLNDMLQNGTVISETLIERPHSFATACNIATQIIAQVASNQYGGQSITLAHLAPFVDISRKAIRADLESKNERLGLNLTAAQIDEMVEEDVRAEVKKGIQTIQYQLITLMTTNGQAPFLTVSMYLDEVPEGQIREDLAMMIEETLLQRYEGVKNEAGAWITPAFPKLIYVLDEDNVRPGSKYFYLTQLAAKCTAKRLVPDYVSAKKMRELKLSKGEESGEGDVYPPMGCNAPDEVVTYRFHGRVFTEGLGRMWRRLAMYHPIKDQAQAQDPATDARTGNYYLDLQGVEIWDSGIPGWVDCLRIVKNNHQKLLRLKFTNGRSMDCTPDHVLTTVDGREVKAKDLQTTDAIPADFGTPATDGGHTVQEDIAWLLGACAGKVWYHCGLSLPVTAGEDEIAQRLGRIVKAQFGLDTKTVVRCSQSEGTRTDVHTVADGMGAEQELTDWLIATLGGQYKSDRHLPPDFLTWDENARLSLLAGIIDAGNCIADDGTGHCAVGSTNKELIQQEMLLVQSLGMPARIRSHEMGAPVRDCQDICADAISNGFFFNNHYEVEFIPRTDLKDYICCAKKRDRMTGDGTQPHPKPQAQLSEVIELLGRHATFDVTTASGHFTVAGLRSHNCRSFLTPDRSGNGFRNVSRALDWTPKPKYWGRFNQGVVTINLVDVALSSKGDEDAFWAILDERLELCHRALRLRHERLKGTLSDAAPILWQHGALARLDKGETIDKLLYGGYSTISLGYAGLYECVKYMMGVSHTEPEKGRPFGLAVMQALNDACTRWKVAEDIDYSVYGTPIESTTYKFAKCLQRRFGNVPGITDHGYITNSYHVCVREEIDAFTKLAFESDFQALSPGGAISYVEVPDMQDNLEAVIAVMQFIYDHIIYAELNTKSDYCQKCGYDGEIRIVEDDGKLVWECPKCGNRDQDTMNVARRTCGYIGTQYWNQGRTQEIRERVLHL